MMVGQIFRYKKQQREKATVIYIYTLNDPRTDEVRYVGRTGRPQERLNSHVLDGMRQGMMNDAVRVIWLRELLKDDLTPYMVIVDEVAYSERREAEAKWTRYYHERGARLTLEPMEMKRMGITPAPDLPT